MSYYGRSRGRGGAQHSGYRGGGGGGRGGDGGGGGRYYGGGNKGLSSIPPPSSTSLVVQTNCFQANYTLKEPTTTCWYMYRIDIIQKKGVKEAERTNDGELPPADQIPDAHPQKIARFQKAIETKGSNPQTRDILKRLSLHLWQSPEKQILATDGACTGIAPYRLFPEDEKRYHIRVDQRQVYAVVLHSAVEVPLGIWFTKPTNDTERSSIDKVEQCLDIIFKHCMISNFKSFGKNPDTFFLKEEHQRLLLHDGGRGRPLFEKYYSRPTPYAPFIGVSQATRFTQDGKFIIAINNKVDWIFRDTKGSNQRDSTHELIPLLDVQGSQLAGVRLRSLDRKIEDPKLRNDIEQKFSKLTFKILYEKGEGWVKHCMDSGKDDGYVRRNRQFFKQDQRMAPARSKDLEGPKIKWSCDEEIFGKKKGEEEVKYDVAQYFAEIYDIKIRFPHLPIISTRRGFFPVEFLYQEATRVPHANDADKVKEVLAYHDKYSGPDRMRHIADIKKIVSQGCDGNVSSLTDLLAKFHVDIDHEPVSFEAKRIASPHLNFSNTTETKTDTGSWNLTRKNFLRPADLSSYAVIDLGRRDMMPVQEVMRSLFRTMRETGMSIGNDGEEGLSRLIVSHDRHVEPHPRQLYELLLEAKNKARNWFLHQNLIGKVGFVTNVVSEVSGKLCECLVTRGFFSDSSGRPVARSGNAFYAIPLDTSQKTHWLTNRETGLSSKARIKLKMPNNQYVDPTERGIIVDDVVGIGYVVDDYDRVIPADEPEPNPRPCYPLEEWQFECPALIFLYMAEKKSEIYDCVKCLNYLEFGINTQCLVQKTCQNQRRMEQYCQNVALKLNTKLFSQTNNACAWGIARQFNDPGTMIFGYSLSHGKLMGKNATTIGGSVCLEQPMQIGQSVEIFTTEHRTDTVETGALKKLVKNLAINYYEHLAVPPRRLVVYRDGGSDGSFERIKGEEIAAVRDAICEMNMKAGMTCPAKTKCELRNCPECAPKITFIVAQKDHNVRLFPTNEREAFKNNVPSGTLVDSYITSYERPGGGFDFLLVPQGGLKGTSKPMHYRTITNENPWTPEQIQRWTYHMSFQYGTATKAPRKVPLLLNSEKIASRVMKCGGYLASLQASLQNALFGINDMDGLVGREGSLGQELGGQLLGGYGVFDRRINFGDPEAWNAGWRVPFRPHITG